MFPFVSAAYTNHAPFLVFNRNCSLRWLDGMPHVYNRHSDDLYEIDKEAIDFIQAHQNIPVAATRYLSCPQKTFLAFCQDEAIFVPATNALSVREFPGDTDIKPSFRYLLMHITRRCNLACQHCYLGEATNLDLSLPLILRTLKHFEEAGGLIAVITGGEPLNHPEFWLLNEALPKFDLRFELLTNGTAIGQTEAGRLNFHKYQISLDGMEVNHNALRRNPNAFQSAIRGIGLLKSAGKHVAVATMIHDQNLQDFPKLSELLDEYEISDWLINEPTNSGKWTQNSHATVDPAIVSKIVCEFSRGEGTHASEHKKTCGSHICSIMSDGKAYPCPLFQEPDMEMGCLLDDTTLTQIWANRKEQLLFPNECLKCDVFSECGGGCRFRARENGGRDIAMCNALLHNGARKEATP